MGYGFYIGAYKSIRHGSANMDVLVVLGTTSAWLYGIVLCFIGHTAETDGPHVMEGMDGMAMAKNDSTVDAEKMI